MIRAFGFILKVFTFSIVVLILGNWLKFRDKTISDQIKTEISHAERSDLAGKIRTWADHLSEDMRQGFKKKINFENRNRVAEIHTPETITTSERQKLKNLIQELNRSAE